MLMKILTFGLVVTLVQEALGGCPIIRDCYTGETLKASFNGECKREWYEVEYYYELHSGQDLRLDITFKADEDYDMHDYSNHLAAEVLGTKIYLGSQKGNCGDFEGLNGDEYVDCQLIHGHEYRYQQRRTVPDFKWEVRTPVQLKLKTVDGSEVLCGQTNVKLI